jgi:basic membrane lipoprotein Med (substrate-binding protein (PBP1-ABC) superfamily)
VSAITEPASAIPAGLTWKGIQEAAQIAGAVAAQVEPGSLAELAADLDRAAAAPDAVVVTIGPGAVAAVTAATAAHPQALFLSFGAVLPAGSPANLHAVVFDEAEAAYLAAFVAAAFSASGMVGLVVDTEVDAASAAFAAGFRGGAPLGRAGAAATIAYAGSPDSPEEGRTAAAGLVKSGVDVVAAQVDLAGVGAMREACARETKLVALAADAWDEVPDVRPCLIGSVLERYDVAIEDILALAASGRPLPVLTVEDISTGGLALSDLHSPAPAGFDARLTALLAALRDNPPRATAPPPSAPAPSVAPTVSA